MPLQTRRSEWGTNTSKNRFQVEETCCSFSSFITKEGVSIGILLRKQKYRSSLSAGIDMLTAGIDMLKQR